MLKSEMPWEDDLRSLPFGIRSEIANILDREKWRILADRLGYTMDQIYRFERNGTSGQNSPTMEVIADWSHRMPTLRLVHTTLEQLGLKSAAYIITQYVKRQNASVTVGQNSSPQPTQPLHSRYARDDLRQPTCKPMMYAPQSPSDLINPAHTHFKHTHTYSPSLGHTTRQTPYWSRKLTSCDTVPCGCKLPDHPNDGSYFQPYTHDYVQCVSDFETTVKETYCSMSPDRPLLPQNHHGPPQLASNMFHSQNSEKDASALSYNSTFAMSGIKGRELHNSRPPTQSQLSANQFDGSGHSSHALNMAYYQALASEYPNLTKSGIDMQENVYSLADSETLLKESYSAMPSDHLELPRNSTGDRSDGALPCTTNVYLPQIPESGNMMASHHPDLTMPNSIPFCGSPNYAEVHYLPNQCGIQQVAEGFSYTPVNSYCNCKGQPFILPHEPQYVSLDCPGDIHGGQDKSPHMLPPYVKEENGDETSGQNLRQACKKEMKREEST